MTKEEILEPIIRSEYGPNYDVVTIAECYDVMQQWADQENTQLTTDNATLTHLLKVERELSLKLMRERNMFDKQVQGMCEANTRLEADIERQRNVIVTFTDQLKNGDYISAYETALKELQKKTQINTIAIEALKNK